MFLIIISLLQICFIPGFILLLLICRNSGRIRLMFVPVYSFALSLFVNFVIVTLLAGLHIYSRTAIFALITAEAIFLGFIILSDKLNIRSYRPVIPEPGTGGTVNILKKGGLLPYDIVYLVSLAFSGILILYLLGITIYDSGQIFREWDAIFSWNRWAIDFASNRLPVSTYHYPQLIPANWSIAYVLCGYPLQFAAKGMMHLFLLLPVCTLAAMGLTKRSAFYLLSSLLLAFALKNFNWREGYVDVPVAFFSFLVYITLELLSDESDGALRLRYYILGGMAACAAAVTKQAGVFLMFMYPLLIYVLVGKKPGRKEFFTSLPVFISLVILVVVPVYLYAEISISKGYAASEIRYVTQEIYNGASYPERFRNAFRIFSGIFSGGVLSHLQSRIVFALTAILFLLSLKRRDFRLLFLLFMLPYSLIWALFFSYDIRNSALVIPFFALGAGFGLDLLMRKLTKSPAV